MEPVSNLDVPASRVDRQGYIDLQYSDLKEIQRDGEMFMVFLATEKNADCRLNSKKPVKGEQYIEGQAYWY